MIEVHTTEDIYPALREIIEEMRKTGLEKQAAILTHRMTKVAWTSRDELFEELVDVLTNIDASQEVTMFVPLSNQVRLVLKTLREAV